MLLIKAARAESRKIEDEIKKLNTERNGKKKFTDQMTEEERKYLRKLYKKKAENRRLTETSICMCKTCSKANNDMYYNPFSETWYCVECVKNYSEAYLKYQKDLSKKPWDVDDYEMEFLKSFTYSGITTQLGKKTS